MTETLPYGQPLLGISNLVRLVYEQKDISEIWSGLLARLDQDGADASALLDIATILIATGQRDKGLEVQQAGLNFQKVFIRHHGDGQGLKLVAFVTAGDLMANTPVDFLLEGSNVTLYLVFIDAETQAIPALPAYDAAIMAIGESAANQPVLARMSALLADWSGPPIFNGKPGVIAAMTRDRVSALLADEPMIVSPTTVQLTRAQLDALTGGAAVGSLLPGEDFPLIVRPCGTHAGEGLDKVDDAAMLGAYLANHPDDSFFIAPFIDYAKADGLYRKQRIVFVHGKAYASHYAVSSHWIVHYLSAEMAERPERRTEEEDWMVNFDTEFAARHAQAFDALYQAFGLDYFGIDCAELADGRLLLFEVDVAMIVHDMDPEDVFPYKKPAMRKLFSAFQTALAEQANIQ